MTKVSIIMGIYNCEDTLEESIQSVICQTFSDWELIMCDDGSIDETYVIASRYQSQYAERIKLIRNQNNHGLNFTLNRCLELVRGIYIARQDGDDVSLPMRIEKEVAFLDNHPEFAIVSTAMVHFDENGDWGVSRRTAMPSKVDLIHATPFAHAACMVRKEAFDAVDGYSVSPWLLRVEDYHLWYKMYLRGFKGMNLIEPLYRCRDDRNAQIRRRVKFRLNECYVKLLIFRNLQLKPKYVFLVGKPILVGLLPNRYYAQLHRKKLRIDADFGTDMRIEG